MTYNLFILGCQYNEWDGARLRYFLDTNGLHESSEKSADLIVVVACSVRQTAIDRIFGKLKNWKNKKVVVTGCVLKNDLKKFTERNVTIIKPGDFKSLSKYLKETFHVHTPYSKSHTPDCHFVPIMTGCNNFCSYCAVPYTRGRETSRPAKEILSDIERLISNGHKEIMLLGQNVNSYQSSKQPARKVSSVADAGGQTVNGKRGESDFSKLLNKINDLDGDFEISFTSNHPKDLTDDIVRAVSALPKIKKEIHLPLQSGSYKILKLMNRPYTKAQYLKIVDMIRKIDPEIDITTDAIVGFPGETLKDFQETVNVFKNVGYKQAFVNKYSPRSETLAYKLGDPIKWSEKQRRWRKLNEIANK